MAETDGQSRAEVQEKLVQRANQDEAFRALLLGDPKAAIRQEQGVSLPPNMRATVLEETPNGLFLVLPLRPAELRRRLVDDGGCYGCLQCAYLQPLRSVAAATSAVLDLN